ncbi:unnamed protein product [marine sediment metagenome]|uniref:CarD-like/TRCF RNAP-interacting domain-containing protein n=1 Tax=marine sediment metagenome TaxID=412755 RepID=X1QIZ6_9ZZZZ
MEKNKTFKVGDKIIHFDQVYRIFKIRKRNKDKIIFFKRYFKTKENRKLVFSIPISSIDETKVRKPISKKKLRDLFKALSQKPEAKIAINTVKAKELLGSNSLDKIIEILKQFWQEKKTDPDHFNKSKENVFKLAIKKLSEEIALVNDISLAKARKKIKNALKKSKNAK